MFGVPGQGREGTIETTTGEGKAIKATATIVSPRDDHESIVNNYISRRPRQRSSSLAVSQRPAFRLQQATAKWAAPCADHGLATVFPTAAESRGNGETKMINAARSQKTEAREVGWGH
ncbi:conserved repeat protein [Anopheles sinensis]|uniref:Conserved repeat protein n=1 Tax=Anopheles sinensis TaxID=74873 RepID=A0A084VM50_ANOSI|nr:conserved repeat protein [Anopheles sinensis]